MNNLEANIQKQKKSVSRKRVGKFMIIIFSILLVGILVFTGFLLAWSPGNPEPLLDDNGDVIANSLSEKVFIKVNDGTTLGMFIKSKNVNNPVLLFLHGGPGMPEYFLTEQYPTGLENDFTVVWWDRRGAGLSFDPDISKESLTIEQSIQDTIAVTNYLRDRFDKDKIYLMGHSGGSFIGIQVAERAPELYYAYIGMAQMTYQVKSEKLAYDYMLQKYKEIGDSRMVRLLEQNPVTLSVPLPTVYERIRDDAMHRLGIGSTRDMDSVITGIFLPSWKFPEYTIGEKVNLWRGKFFSHAVIWNEMIATDLTQEISDFELPVYFLHGKYDYTCSYDLANEYFSKISVPLKGFYTFDNSAHSPIFEEPKRMREVLQEIILAVSLQ
jgi:pimeloyl-ACP methyl ester carboxylesterase